MSLLHFVLTRSIQLGNVNTMAAHMTAQTKKNFFLAAAPLLLIIFIDSMGLGLVFPVLNALIIDPARSILSTDTSAQMRNLIFGVIVSSFMLCWFFGAAFLGDLSDQVGRKKSLSICLIGSFIGYLFSAFGASVASLSFLIIGRIVAGFTSGSQSVAQAAIVDLSTPETKARNIGFIQLFSSLGFIVGPILGGVLSDNTLVNWFTFATPFYFAAIISLLNVVLLYWLFEETFINTKKIKIKLHYAIEIFISAFKNEHVKELSVIFLIMLLGWSSFYSFISMFLFIKYGFTPMNIAMFMALMGVGFGIGNGCFVGYCAARFPLKNSIVVSLCVSIISVLVIVGTSNPLYAWGAVMPLAAAMSVAYALTLTLFSNQVNADSQGWVMGITGAIMAFAFGATGIAVSMLAALGEATPMFFAALTLAISAVLIAFWYKDSSDKKAEYELVI